MIEVWSKIDLIKDEKELKNILQQLPPNAVPVSAADGTGMAELMQARQTLNPKP